MEARNDPKKDDFQEQSDAVSLVPDLWVVVPEPVLSDRMPQVAAGCGVDVRGLGEAV